MIDVEVFGAEVVPEAPGEDEVRRLCTLAAASRAVEHGHVAVEFVDPERIAALNERHRGRPGPTDVLSFPIDGDEPQPPGEPLPRELGDIVICPAHTRDLREAVVHGMLHLLGMDHEVDDGDMLALQARLLRDEAR